MADINSPKIEPLLRAALNATPVEFEDSGELSTGFDPTSQLWEVIIRYNGELSDIAATFPDLSITELLGGYALLTLPQALIPNIAESPQITYIEKPKRLFFEVDRGRASSCITSLQSSSPATYTGQGVLLAIIDSGIDFTHPDFRDASGNTRILALWDQTIPADPSLGTIPPEGYHLGTLYSKELLDEALQLPNPSVLCPSVDLSGHGTHVAGIAGGNGRASEGRYRGVAYESTFLIVKLGSPDPLGFPSTSQLMQAVDFCVRTALHLNIPMAVNLSFGNTYGSHSGTSLLETYLDAVSQLGKINIVAGNGNEGASAGHVSGNVSNNETAKVEFAISDYQQNLSIQIWKKYWDEMRFTITAPGGNSIVLPDTAGAWRFTLEGTQIYAYLGEPSPFSIYQETYLDFLPNNTYLTPGIWSIRVQPQQVVEGNYELWMPVEAVRNFATQFLQPTPDTTLTIPSTAGRVISVGAYDANRLQLAGFSGRGYTWATDRIKPELAAPGVEITSCAPGGSYTTRSGTSMATPFVTGSCAILMQWGILMGNDPFLYGEKIKAYLIKGAKPLSSISTYPNPEIGWGVLCLRNSFPTR